MNTEISNTNPEIQCKSSRIKQVKEHLNNNKKTYIVGIASAATVAVVMALMNKKQATTIINTIAPVFNNTQASDLGGYLRKIVYCEELDQYFSSVTEAAKAAGVSLVDMSRHVNGHRPDVRGNHYRIIGVAN